MGSYDLATFVTGDHGAIAIAELRQGCLKLTIQERDQIVTLAFFAGTIQTEMLSVQGIGLIPECLYSLQPKTYQSHLHFSPSLQK